MSRQSPMPSIDELNEIAQKVNLKADTLKSFGFRKKELSYFDNFYKKIKKDKKDIQNKNVFTIINRIDNGGNCNAIERSLVKDAFKYFIIEYEQEQRRLAINEQVRQMEIERKERMQTGLLSLAQVVLEQEKDKDEPYRQILQWVSQQLLSHKDAESLGVTFIEQDGISTYTMIFDGKDGLSTAQLEVIGSESSYSLIVNKDDEPKTETPEPSVENSENVHNAHSQNIDGDSTTADADLAPNEPDEAFN